MTILCREMLISLRMVIDLEKSDCCSIDVSCTINQLLVVMYVNTQVMVVMVIYQKFNLQE